MEGIEALITTPDPEWPGCCVCAGLHPETRMPVMLRVKGLDWDEKICVRCDIAYVLSFAQTERLRRMLTSGLARSFDCRARNGTFTLLLTSLDYSGALTKR